MRKRMRVIIVAGRRHNTDSKKEKKEEISKGSNHSCTGRATKRLSVKRPRHTLLSRLATNRSVHFLPFFLLLSPEAPVPGLKGKWYSFYHLLYSQYSAFRRRFVIATRKNAAGAGEPSSLRSILKMIYSRIYIM